jgi:16S rRNA (uracil1498-N3)-methyltransferase
MAPTDRESTWTTPRLYVAAALHEGARIAASPGQAHYLGTVLRRASGAIVRLFNGADGEWTARLAFSDRHRLTMSIESRLRAQSPERGPWLVFALLKRDATDLVVRQAVELGASRLLPAITERTNAARVNPERLNAIAIEAAEQSERLTVPAIDPPVRLDGLLANWPAERHLFVALERSEPSPEMPRPDMRQPEMPQPEMPQPEMPQPEMPQPDTTLRRKGPAGLLIGPEGGFSPSERASLRELPFVTAISLGPFVLRAETAAAAGQALLLGMGWADYVPPM